MVNPRVPLSLETIKGQLAVSVESGQADDSSFIDILFLGRIFPRRASIMAKKELKWMPLLGQYRKLTEYCFNGVADRTVTTSGAVWVNRKDRKDAMRSMQQAGEDMKKNGVSQLASLVCRS
jgi:lysophosphatidate acyltransferase